MTDPRFGIKYIRMPDVSEDDDEYYNFNNGLTPFWSERYKAFFWTDASGGIGVMESPERIFRILLQDLPDGTPAIVYNMGENQDGSLVAAFN